MSSSVNTATGELQDRGFAEFMESLRDLDQRIAEADDAIGAAKEALKTAKQHREGLVSELRASARGERVLPLADEDAS